EVGLPVGPPGKGVGVARGASPYVGVGGFHHDMGGIGPVVVQALPDAARALRDVGVRRAAVMHLEVLVRAVAKELRTAGSEVGQGRDELFGRRRGRLVQVDRCHARAPWSGEGPKCDVQGIDQGCFTEWLVEAFDGPSGKYAGPD